MSNVGNRRLTKEERVFIAHTLHYESLSPRAVGALGRLLDDLDAADIERDEIVASLHYNIDESVALRGKCDEQAKEIERLRTENHRLNARLEYLARVGEVARKYSSLIAGARTSAEVRAYREAWRAEREALSEGRGHA